MMTTKRIDCRKLSPEGQEKLRKQVTSAIIERKMKQQEAVTLFQVSRAAIIKWLKEYREKGAKSLDKKEKGRPKATGKLNSNQMIWIINNITASLPDKFGLPFFLWNRIAVKALIKKKWKEDLSLLTVGRFFIKHLFIPQKPVRIPIEANTTSVETWLKTDYSLIVNIAKKEKAEIHWGAVTTIDIENKIANINTSPKNKTVQNRKCYMISSLKNNGQFYFSFVKDQVNADMIVDFFQRLTKSVSKKIILIVTDYKVYEKKKVVDWLDANSEKIELFLCPAGM